VRFVAPDLSPALRRIQLPLKDLDLQSKVTLVLLAVILPAFLIVAVAGNALTRPWLENEVRQIATGVGQAFALEITGSKWLVQDELNPRVERRIRELVYQQPNIVRLDVLAGQGPSAPLRVIGSSMEQDSSEQAPIQELSLTPQSRIIADEEGERFWEIVLPVFSSPSAYSLTYSDSQRPAKKLIGNIYILGSLGFVERLHGLIWRSTGIGAFLAFLTLFVTLRYFLRRTIENEKRLTLAESRNLKLTEKLHETQRELMNKEKLAVMGQLTASFAHEIGTPLNAMGGHLQLLEFQLDESERDQKSKSRILAIRSQLEKIESIVKGFLQNTARPPSQRQWVDLNALVDKTLCFVAPRAETLGVTVRRELDRNLGPVRAIPLEMEQILLNLVNNSLDALEAKKEQSSRKSLVLQVRSFEVSTLKNETSEPQVELEVYDTGEGISKQDLRDIFKPFFTTKPAGQGTGLGLTISQELAASNGASLHLNSKKGYWTRATLQVPYA